MTRRWLPPLITVLVLLGVWQLYCTLGHINADVVPPPGDVAASLANNAGLLWSNFKVTAGEVAVGMGLALLCALPLAALIHLSTTLRNAIYPLLIASQTVPIPTIGPLLLIWFGFTETPKLILVALTCFFPIVVATLDGLASVDPDLPKLMRTLGASRGQTFFRVEAPSALPQMFSGLRVAVTFSVIAAIFAEYNQPNAGLGHLMVLASNQEETAEVFAAIIVLAFFAILLFLLLGLAQRRLLPWAPK